MAECLKCSRQSKPGKNCVYCDEFVPYPQPTDDELHAAWTAAIHAENIPGARSATMAELVRLRNTRSTWFGTKENELRLALDAYLRPDIHTDKELQR